MRDIQAICIGVNITLLAINLASGNRLLSALSLFAGATCLLAWSMYR